MNEIKMNKYRVTYRDDNGKLKCKIVLAKTDTGALIRFKHQTGVKALTAKYMPTKEEKKLLEAAHRKQNIVNGRATYFDGRCMCYIDNDAPVTQFNGYEH